MTATRRTTAPISFGPRAFHALLDSFDQALGSIRESDASSPQVRDLLARRVISLAEHGELDPDRLREAALAQANSMTRYYGGADRA